MFTLKKTIFKIWLFASLTTGFYACTPTMERLQTDALRYNFGNILNISLTPDSTIRRVGCFTDAGSWMGFTLPQAEKWINGFCGPFSIL